MPRRRRYYVGCPVVRWVYAVRPIMRLSSGRIVIPYMGRAERGDLSDAEWERLRPCLPVSNGRCGRWRDHRQVIDGILHRVRTGVRGQEPAQPPLNPPLPGTTCSRAEHRVRSGTRPKLVTARPTSPLRGLARVLQHQPGLELKANSRGGSETGTYGAVRVRGRECGQGRPGVCGSALSRAALALQRGAALVPVCEAISIRGGSAGRPVGSAPPRCPAGGPKHNRSLDGCGRMATAAFRSWVALGVRAGRARVRPAHFRWSGAGPWRTCTRTSHGRRRTNERSFRAFGVVCGC